MGMKSAEPGVFRQAFPLHYPDADAAGFVRLTSLLNLLQIQATEHTLSLGYDYREHKAEGVFWVLSRLTLRFDSWPRWPCVLTVDTWARSTKAVFALRDFRFGNETDEWVGRGSSAWVLLKNRKPQRPEPWVALYEQTRPEEPVAEMPAALPALNAAFEAERRAEALVRRTHGVYADWEDLDMNGHVNNVNAVGWCLAQHTYEFLTEYQPETLEANFLAEMFCGEKFMVLLEEGKATEDAKVFDYLVVREPDQTPTLRLRIGFRRF